MYSCYVPERSDLPKTLLYNAGAVSMDAGLRMFQRGAVLIENERILAVGPSVEVLLQAGPDAVRVDLSGRCILHGFINMRVPSSQQVARSLGDDMDLLTWLHERIWPYESSLTKEDCSLSTLLCGLE